MNTKKISVPPNVKIIQEAPPKKGVQYEYGTNKIITEINRDYTQIRQATSKHPTIWVNYADGGSSPISFFRSNITRERAFILIVTARQGEVIKLPYREFFEPFAIRGHFVNQIMKPYPYFTDIFKNMIDQLSTRKGLKVFNENKRTVVDLEQFDIELLSMNRLPPRFLKATQRNRLIVSLLEFMDDNHRFHVEIPNDVLLARFLSKMRS